MNLIKELTIEVFLKDQGLFDSIFNAFRRDICFWIEPEKREFIQKFIMCFADKLHACELQIFIFELCVFFINLHSSIVLSEKGSFIRRSKFAKIQVQKFEMDRVLRRNVLMPLFLELCSIKELGGELSNSKILFFTIENYVYDQVWVWISQDKGMDISNFIRERTTDIDFVFSPAILSKIYDITGYLCGNRVNNILKYKRTKLIYRSTFQTYYTYSKISYIEALALQLPAEYLFFREKSEGLFYAKKENFNFIKLMQSIWMQSLTTDVLIIFNAYEPVKRIRDVIINSKNVQNAFLNSCGVDLVGMNYKVENDLATAKDAISFLFQFIVDGFIRVYAKDLYAIRLASSLFSKSGVNGIRTSLLASSAQATKKMSKDTVLTSIPSTTPPRTFTHPSLYKDGKFKCYCGKGFKSTSKGYIERHIGTCTVFANKEGVAKKVSESERTKNDLLNDLIELESCEDVSDFDENSSKKIEIRQINADKEENEYEEEYFDSISQDDDNSPVESSPRNRLKSTPSIKKRKLRQMSVGVVIVSEDNNNSPTKSPPKSRLKSLSPSKKRKKRSDK